MWFDFQDGEGGKPKEPQLIVALSTSMPQYKALYSQARELGAYMLRKMEFKKLATIRSSAFPPEVLVREAGVSSLPECGLYFHAGRRDILLLTGDTSPMEDQYGFAKALLSKAEELGVKELYSVGARWAENPVSPDVEPEANGFASDQEGIGRLKKVGVKILTDEPAPFFASMVVAMAKDHGMRGYKLSVDHGEPSPHARSVVKLLEVLSSLAGFEVDVGELKSQLKAPAPTNQPGSSAIYR